MEVIKPVHVNDENAKRAERIHASFFNIFQDKLEELQRYISDDNNKKKLTAYGNRPITKKKAQNMIWINKK